ncbi:MAG: CopD family protein [Burkholderia sp.]|nr:CopD family protein [Burkholderia sp.]
MIALWVKIFHIVLVSAWFAGLFYLPRIFVNLALEIEEAAINRLLIMARKLFYFMTLIAIPAISSGFWLAENVSKYQGWLRAKIAIVLLLIGYHAYCGYLLQVFKHNNNRRSDRWYRVFNELPIIGMLAAVALVVIKPF